MKQQQNKQKKKKKIGSSDYGMCNRRQAVAAHAVVFCIHMPACFDLSTYTVG